ncbi:IS110 family transposase [Bernardetia sp.]|uniref:IS110 family transposase n=1 Tax=Bernardetia sp. TaxID=1937974 RepID=UPI0025B98ECC|nr:IS110 family transposase [Bernardetia sp.]
MSKQKLSKKDATSAFPVVYPLSAGIDVGAGQHYVSVPAHLTDTPTRVFSTHTKGLTELADWLVSLGITTVAMESTGIYWLTVYDILVERNIEVCLANARYVRNVPGRKTDVKDSQWLQQLHSVGLLHRSFIPNEQIRVLRTYLRLRHQQVIAKGQAINRIEKSLQQMNIKLRQVISKIDTQVGMGIVRAIAAGEYHPTQLAEEHYNYRMKSSKEELARALEGNYRAEYLFTLKQALRSWDFAHSELVLCEEEIERILQNWEKDSEELEDISSKSFVSKQKKKKVRQNEYRFDVRSYLKEILGVDMTKVEGLSENTVLDIVGEVGTDLSKWKTAKHFCSWLGLAPSPQISGGKVLKQFRKKMQSRATQAFRTAASTLHSSKTHLGKIYRKLAITKGSQVAVKTVARKLATLFYTLITQ